MMYYSQMTAPEIIDEQIRLEARKAKLERTDAPDYSEQSMSAVHEIWEILDRLAELKKLMPVSHANEGHDSPPSGQPLPDWEQLLAEGDDSELGSRVQFAAPSWSLIADSIERRKLEDRVRVLEDAIKAIGKIAYDINTKASDTIVDLCREALEK